MSYLDIDIQRSYRSCGDSNIANAFITPALKCTKVYRRSVGYFSSNVFLTILDGVVALARNNGSVQLIASPKLSSEDIEAINHGYAERDKIIRDGSKMIIVVSMLWLQVLVKHGQPFSQPKNCLKTTLQ